MRLSLEPLMLIFRAAMNPLKEKIIERIRSEGPMSFDTFMEMALYYPGLGYYTKDSTSIGRSGDFYTSPHLHPIFGAMIGKQMEEMWDFMGRPDLFRIVEMGAGMGYLAGDMLEYLRRAKGEVQSSKFYEHLEYTIVELNPAMQERQQALLSQFTGKIQWASATNELDSVRGCFLSNELLDAFPVRMVVTDDGLKEIYLSIDRDDLVEVKMPCSDEVLEYFGGLAIELPEGYRSEVNLRVREWLREVCNVLAEGFVLTIDYGYPAWDYYSEDRNRGTLLCYHQHQVSEDPYRDIGEQDLTAHVNFSSLKRWGEELGLKTVGFCPQGLYLVSLGIDEAITESCGCAPDPFEISKIKSLLLPTGMGESHKVMVQYKGNGVPKLRGFAVRDYSRKL